MREKPHKRASRSKRSARAASVSAQRHYRNGLALHRQGRLARAEDSYREALRVRPTHVDALHLLGVIAYQRGEAASAADLIGQAVAIDPDCAAAYNNLGNALSDLAQYEIALTNFERCIELKPDDPLAYNNRGRALSGLERPEDALASYDRAIALDPGYAEAHNNRSNVLRGLGEYDPALASLEKAILLKPDFTDAHVNRGHVLQDQGRHTEAVASYDAAIALRPACGAAHRGRGVSLDHLRSYAASLLSYERAIGLDAEDAEAHNARGNALRALRRFAAARASYDRAIELQPGRADFYYNRGAVWADQQHYEAALANYDQVLALDPDYPYLLGIHLYARRKICEWRDSGDQLAGLLSGIERQERVTTPFSAIALLNSPAAQRRAAELWIGDKHPPRPDLPPIDARGRSERIRIGYFSADFHDHATCYLIAELFEKHDRKRFELIGFSYGPDVNQAMRRRVAAAFDRFVDVEALPDRDIALLARTLHVDIAVDLKGFTADNRVGVFAYRAAPLQVGYLGYPGTMGADYIDYIIADGVLIPEAHRPHYSEKIVYLPNSYQVNDSTRQISSKAFSRRELELPESGFVFCCFNNNYKVSPDTFDRWMRILERVDDSVLWLIEDNPRAAQNLRNEARDRGVNPERLVFARRMPQPEHLARHRAADLFLDTMPYNAHTTASDALWAGLPVLTCIGHAFAGRVAASLLSAIGLPELITSTPEAYETLAVLLATDPPRLQRIRESLGRNRHSSSLFDTALFTAHLEDAYTQMYERQLAGLAPAHIFVEH
jgi:predicted O-linked N-acetylglucosamine transferase (SPINDLY family)